MATTASPRVTLAEHLEARVLVSNVYGVIALQWLAGHRDGVYTYHLSTNPGDVILQEAARILREDGWSNVTYNQDAAGEWLVVEGPLQWGGSPIPVIDSVDPALASSTETTGVNVYGRGFTDGAKVFIGTLILQTTFVTSQKLNVTIPPGTTVGVYTVEVDLPDGQVATLADAFEIQGPREPTVSIYDVFPWRGPPDVDYTIRIDGEGFDSSARVFFSKEGQPGTEHVIPADRMDIISPALMYVTIPEDFLEVSTEYDVKVVLMSGLHDTKPKGYRTGAEEFPNPVAMGHSSGNTFGIQSITPTVADTDNLSLTLTGYGFTNTMQVYLVQGDLEDPEAETLQGGVAYVSATSFSGTINNPTEAGTYIVKIVDGADYAFCILPYVRKRTVAITSISPSSHDWHESITVTITGTGFYNSMRVGFYNRNYHWLPENIYWLPLINVVDSQKIRAVIPAESELRINHTNDMVVEDTNSGSRYWLSECYTAL